MLGSLTLALSGRLVVDGDVVVTGRVGRERMVKLSQQIVLLDQRTQVSGKAINECLNKCRSQLSSLVLTNTNGCS